MRVLLIDVNCKSSSTGQIVYNLYSYVNSHGDEAAVCYGRGEEIAERNIFKFGLDWETYLHAFLTRLTGYTGCFSFFSTRRLIKYIEEFKPDVVHIHELHAYFVNIKQLLEFLSEKNIRIVHTLHCEFSYTGKCGHSAECDKWKTECGSCPHLNEYPSTLFFDHTNHMFRVKRKCFSKLPNPTYVVPSKWLYGRIKESFMGANDIRLVHNSIDTTLFNNKEDNGFKKNHGIPENKKIVLAVAPDLLSENKGGKYVLSLASIMKDVFFILIGGKEEQSIRDNVASLGIIYDKELLSRYYSVADVFLICSKNENFPTTCIEAICCKTPVVGFDAGGAKEVATGKLGKFVQYGDLEELEKAVREMISADLKVYENEFAEKLKYYSSDRMCAEYYSIYAEK